MMRVRFPLALTVLVVSLPMLLVPSRAADVKIGVGAAVVVTPEDRGLETALAVGLLAAFFDVSVTVVVPLYPKHGFDETALLLAVHIKSGKPIRHIRAMHARGHGWGVIAHRLGVHPGALNQRRVWGKKRDFAVVLDFGDWVLSVFFGVEPKHMRALRNQKHPISAIVVALNVHAQTGKPLARILQARKAGKPWAVVGKGFGLSSTALKTPPKPKRHFVQKSKAKRNQGKGKAGGSDNGQGRGGPPR